MTKPVRWSEEMINDYITRGYWDDTTLYDLWERNARAFPEREAIADSRLCLTWAEAKQWIDRLALGFVELGLKKDDVIVIQIPNSVEQTLLRVACEKAGIVSVPALRSLRHTEMEYILRYCDAVGIAIPWEVRDFNYYRMIQEVRPRLPRLQHLFVVGEKVPEGTHSFMEMVKRPIEKSYPPNYLQNLGLPSIETSLVLLTTGTTGLPKFVEYAACHRIWQWKMNAKHLVITGDDVFALITPHCGGIALPAFFGSPLVGAKLVILDSPDMEDAFRLIEKERVTFACVVPTQLAMMVEHPRCQQYDLSSMRLWWCTGAALPYDVGRAVEEKLGGKVVPLIGATDWGCECLNLPSVPQPIRFKTVGKPIDGSEIKLVADDGTEVPPGEVGEIWGRGPTAVSGYFKDPESTREVWTGDGWYMSGDLGMLDEMGNLVVVGRKKDMIIRGGQNIYPIEIENLLRKHPKISEVAVVGMPDPLMGQRACAFVAPHPGQGFSFDEMISFLRERNIASFKLPERLELIKEIPMLGAGQKVDKKLLVTLIAEKLKAEGKIK